MKYRLVKNGLGIIRIERSWRSLTVEEWIHVKIVDSLVQGIVEITKLLAEEKYAKEQQILANDKTIIYEAGEDDE